MFDDRLTEIWERSIDTHRGVVTVALHGSSSVKTSSADGTRDAMTADHDDDTTAGVDDDDEEDHDDEGAPDEESGDAEQAARRADLTANRRLGRITRRDALLGALHLDLIATLLRYVDPHAWGSQAEVAVPVWAILSRCVQHSTAFAELIVLGTATASLTRLPSGQEHTARELRVVLERWWGHLDCFLMVPTIAPAPTDPLSRTAALPVAAGPTLSTPAGMNASSWLALVAAIRFVTHACQSSQRFFLLLPNVLSSSNPYHPRCHPPTLSLFKPILFSSCI